MIKIENFDTLEPSGISYGGHGGSKRGIIINGERWFLKYPKSTKSMYDDECNKAVLRVIPKINMDKIANIFSNIPEKYIIYQY